jgi:hypothetical protein
MFRILFALKMVIAIAAAEFLPLEGEGRIPHRAGVIARVGQRRRRRATHRDGARALVAMAGRRSPRPSTVGPGREDAFVRLPQSPRPLPEREQRPTNRASRSPSGHHRPSLGRPRYAQPSCIAAGAGENPRHPTRFLVTRTAHSQPEPGHHRPSTVGTGVERDPPKLEISQKKFRGNASGSGELGSLVRGGLPARCGIVACPLSGNYEPVAISGRLRALAARQIGGAERFVLPCSKAPTGRRRPHRYSRERDLESLGDAPSVSQNNSLFETDKNELQRNPRGPLVPRF